ncbi:MAG TPA: hypothetical protein VNU22_03380 [Candidatus Acidoferrum sp.]|jgi:hypothetical protein|nr:hypothetical protein [Candidatus Acidoferrum sp.]
MRFFLAPVFASAIFFGAMRAAWAGPPYQTDDPVPVAYRNYEIYIGYEGEYRPGDSETSLPFAEINYGPLPNVQISGSFPLTFTTNPNGRIQSGAGNEDFGIKYRFIPEDASRPQVAFYPSIGVPAGIESPEADGSTQTLFLPLWAQKTIGRATLFGGGGWERNFGAGSRNFWSGGLASTYGFSDRIGAGLEIYATGADRSGERGSTSIGIGMNDDYSAIHSVLFSIGQSIAGTRTFHAYLSYELRLGPGEDTSPVKRALETPSGGMVPIHSSEP